MMPVEQVRKYHNRIINVHPALIPSFCGKGFYGIRPHEAVLKSGVKVTGATVHFVDEVYEAGLELFGTEVKSIRAGKVNLKDSYVSCKTGEAILIGMHVSPYEHGNIFNHDPMRSRRLLLHRKEINKLIGLTQQQGYTLIPLKLYYKGQQVKLKLGLCRGKKDYD